MKKILIIQTASIGDVILATPVIEKLHKVFPEANIDFLLKKGNEALFDDHPFLNRMLIWDKKDKKYKNFLHLMRVIRDNKYDLVVNIQRFFSSGLLTVLSGAKSTVGFNKNPWSLFFSRSVKHKIKRGNVHEIERNLELIHQINDNINTTVKLYPSVRDFAKMSQYKTKQYITVSPASLWYTKQYPKEKWVEFLKQIDPEIVVYMLGAKNDFDLCDEIINTAKLKLSLNLAGKLSFLESAALMKDAFMNYTNDSAPLHLASSVNAKVTAVFCSTVPQFGFGPLSDNSAVVEVREDLSCRPCGLHGFNKCPEKHFKCALDIETNDLLTRLI